MGLLVVVSLLTIFRDVAFSLVDNILVPIISKVKPDSPAVFFCTIIFVIATYLTNGLLVYKKNYIKHPERSFYFMAIALVFYLFFRCDGHFVYYGVWHMAYVDAAFITAAILEFLSYLLPVNKNKMLDANATGFVSDNPTKTDTLGRTNYAELLLEKICMAYKSGALADGSITILLDERYGAGKTTFFNIIEDKAKGKMRTCVFKPWQTSDEGGMTEELLSLLEEQYAISNHLGKQLEGYSKLLSGDEIKNALGLVSHVMKRRDSLSKRYESIKELLQIINDPLIVLVDDVDRLQAEELLALLKLVRNGADFPNIIYLVAADKEAMSQMLEMKGINDADDYLKKFFNFELLFPIDDSYLSSLLREQIVNILAGYYGERVSRPYIYKEFLSARYIQDVFHSPRDVYRFVNLMTYMLDLFKRFELLEEVYVPDLLKLLLIQFISPMAYKILRDEMNLLLDVRGHDGRIHLKGGYKEIIMSRQSRRHLQDLIAQVRQDNNNFKEEPDDNAKDKDERTLFDIPAEERPSIEDIVSELLRDMFYDTQNFQVKSRICYRGEYFKFFAGKYSKSELSAKYMKELIEMPNEEDFVERMNQTIAQGKADFLVHKLKQYIEDKTIKKDIPFVLARCITIQDAIYRDWAQKQSFGISPVDYYQLDQFQSVYSNLLVVEQQNVITDREEKERVNAIYVKNKKYAWLASSLKLPISAEHDMFFVYGQKLHLKLRENLISRFIVEELTENPFEIEKIMAIPMLKDLYHVYWDKQFKEYVTNSSEPRAWLYILWKPSGNVLEWNYRVYHNLVGERLLDSYAKDFLGLKLSQEISLDLAQISGIKNGAALTETNFGHHPFLLEAKKWWDSQERRSLDNRD